jgi:hypothetical protein
MQPQFNTYDSLYHLRVVYKSLEPPLNQRLELFFQGIRHDLEDNVHPLKKNLEKRLSDVFEFRLAAVQEMRDDNLDLKAIHKQASGYFKKIQKRVDMSGLMMGVSRALEVSNKVSGMLLNIETQKKLLDSNEPIQKLSLDEYLKQSNKFFQNPLHFEMFGDWVKSSLYIDYILIASAIIYDEKIYPEFKRIEELTSLVNSATDVYSSLADEFNIAMPLNPGKIARNTSGAAFFKKMLADKQEIQQHIKSGKLLQELSKKHRFVKPLSSPGK